MYKKSHKRSARIGQMAQGQSLRLWMLSSCLLASACTTLNPEAPLHQDDAFSLASFDASSERTNSILRSVEPPSQTVADTGWLQRDFYLPHRMLKSLPSQVRKARRALNEESLRHAPSLRVLAIDALMQGQAQEALGYLKVSGGRGSELKLSGEDRLIAGIAHGLLGDHQRARKLLSEAAQTGSVSGSAMANLGLLSFRFGNSMEAFDFFKNAVAAEPRSAPFNHMAAEVAYASGKHALALSYYEKLLAMQRNDFLGHYNMGLVYLYGLRDYSSARQKFRHVIDHPNSPDGLRALADGAFTSVRREEESEYGLASTDLK